MTLTQLMPTIHALSRADKFRLIQLLTDDVASEEGIVLGGPEEPIPFWSQYDAQEGASVLLQLLDL